MESKWVAIPVPEFILDVLIAAGPQAVISAGYHSRYGWTDKWLDVELDLDEGTQQQMKQLGKFYRAVESNGAIKREPKLIEFEKLLEMRLMAPLIGFTECHVPFMKEVGTAEKVFGSVRNTGHSDWDDYLWAGYNDVLLLAKVPVERCLIPAGAKLCTADSEVESEGLVAIPFMHYHEISEVFVQVADSSVSDGERAWVSLTDPEKIVWGSGHGYARPDQRVVLQELAKPVVAKYLAKFESRDERDGADMDGNTHVFA